MSATRSPAQSCSAKRSRFAAKDSEIDHLRKMLQLRQGKQARRQHRDLVATNKFLAAAQKTTSNGIRYWKGALDFDKAVLISVTDASFAAEVRTSETGRKSGHRSQAGRFLLMADKMPKLGEPAKVYILEWTSHTIRKVCRSTLQAEVLSSIDGCEAGQYLRTLLFNMSVPKPIGLLEQLIWKREARDSRLLYWLSDCRSYVDTMSSTGQQLVTDKRLAIDLTALRQDLWRIAGIDLGEPSTQEHIPEHCTDQLWWISARDMVSDGLTKAMVWDNITKLCSQGVFALSAQPVRAATGMQGL